MYYLLTGYGPHGYGRFTFTSKPTQEVVADFDRGRYLRKHVPFKHIGDFGLINQEISIPYEPSCSVPFCLCNNFEDCKALEIAPGKLSPVPKNLSSQCSGEYNDTGSGTRYSSPTTTTSSFSTPRERASIRTQHEIDTNEQLQHGEVLKCYVNVFTQCISTALYIRREAILNINVYVKNKYVSTYVPSPTIYSGYFNWYHKLPILLSGSINGSSTKFTNLQHAVKSAKCECHILMNMIDVFNSSDNYNTLYSFRSVSRSHLTNVSSDAVNDDRSVDQELFHTFVYDITDDSQLEIVSNIIFPSDFHKLNTLLVEHIQDVKPMSSFMNTLITIFRRSYREKKMLENPNYLKFLQEFNKLNTIFSEHQNSTNGINYQLILPNPLDGKLYIQITTPSIEKMTARIDELKSFVLSTLIHE